ncbi:MAG: hypothetical protein V4850_21400 [Myxococcota bacterium]
MTHPSSQPSPSPSQRDHHLDESVATLATRGDYIGVVRIVEAWAAQGTPTPRARLAEARAFFHLRLMDRALNRTREVLEGDPDQSDALLLQAEIYLERGWPLKARKPLQQLRDQQMGGPGRDDIEAFWVRAQSDPVRPEAQAREIERENQPARLLTLAERFLATGSFLRATGILERLRRVEPDNARVKELLWSLAGDFGANGQSVDALVTALLPPSANPARDHTLDEPEHTESFGLRSVDLDPETAEATNFPALFKYAPRGHEAQGSVEEDRHEATQASGLASAAEMVSNASDGTDPGRQLLDVLPNSNSADTQIMLVLRPGEDRPAQLHRKKDDGGDGGLRETLNLRAWQASMGVSSTSDLADTPDDLLEEEDENVVVMTRGGVAAPVPQPEAAATFGKPIEVIEKHATPIAPERVDPAYLHDEPPPAPPSRLWPRALLAAAALFAAVVLLVAAVFVGSLGARSGASTVRDEVVRALAEEDYNALLTQEGRLEQRVATGDRASEIADVRAALAETQLVLWSDYNGDPTRIAKVREGLEKPAQLDVHRLAILRAGEALARQDVAGASAALGRERPEDDEERLLFARIAARGGDLDRALEHFDAIDRGDQPRYSLARAEVLAAAGRKDDARALVQALLASTPDHAAARILSLELDEAPPAKVVSSVDQFLQSPAGTTLAPRLEGRLQALRAHAFLALGSPTDARDAIERGLSRDGANPDLLFLHAADLAAEQQLTAALHELKSVVTARPGAAEAQAAYVLLLLELDRVEEADEAVVRLEAASMLANLTPVLDTLVSVWGNQEPPGVQLLPPQAATPLGAYASALLAVQDRSTEALGALQAAVTATSASTDPFERRLAPRLVAMQALVTGPPAGDPFITAALAANAEDPAVHVFAGRYFETADRKALAAQHFDRAAQLGPELGLAWYEKGRFYLDARDGFARSGAAWRTFLALAPSGPRATRAKDTLGVR